MPDAPYRGRRVLVTGGTGFVGRHLVEQLTAQGADVVVPIHRRPLPREFRTVTTVPADLTRPEDALAATAGVDDVFHAAGVSAGAGASPAEAIAGVTTNLVLTARILDAVAARGIGRCLLFSSSTVYPELDHPAGEDEVWQAPPHPAYFGYGWMRRYFERLGQFVARQTGTQVAIVRPTAIYGRHDTFDSATSHFVPALIRRALARERPFVVWGTGEETRDLLHVSDLARGCLLALDRRATAGPINIGAGRAVTVREVVELILDAAGYADADVRFDPTRPVTVRSRAIDCGLARTALGFAPTVALADGLRDTVRWYAASLHER